MSKRGRKSNNNKAGSNYNKQLSSNGRGGGGKSKGGKHKLGKEKQAQRRNKRWAVFFLFEK